MCLIYNSIDLAIEWKLAITREPQGSTRDIECVCGTAVKPMKKKVDAILKMDRPKNRTQVRSFIGAVNYYRSLWPRRAHFMKPLSELTSSKVNFQWGVEQQEAFETLKRIMAANCIDVYPG